MTLKGIQVVYDFIFESFFCAPGSKTKYFERSLLPFNKQYTKKKRRRKSAEQKPGLSYAVKQAQV